MGCYTMCVSGDFAKCPISKIARFSIAGNSTLIKLSIAVNSILLDLVSHSIALVKYFKYSKICQQIIMLYVCCFTFFNKQILS